MSNLSYRPERPITKTKTRWEDALLTLITYEEQTTNQIKSRVPIARDTMLKYLQLLVESGSIIKRRDGNDVYWRKA